jgi:hypothetical protein
MSMKLLYEIAKGISHFYFIAVFNCPFFTTASDEIFRYVNRGVIRTHKETIFCLCSTSGINYMIM